jgi:hypothetical protein
VIVCLTGEFLDLFWEGESSVVDYTGKVLLSAKEEDALDIREVTITFGKPH